MFILRFSCVNAKIICIDSVAYMHLENEYLQILTSVFQNVPIKLWF